MFRESVEVPYLSFFFLNFFPQFSCAPDLKQSCGSNGRWQEIRTGRQRTFLSNQRRCGSQRVWRAPLLLLSLWPLLSSEVGAVKSSVQECGAHTASGCWLKGWRAESQGRRTIEAIMVRQELGKATP